MRLLHPAIALSLIAAASVPAHGGIFGLSKFKVGQTDDRFSTDGLTTFTGQNNRISKKSLAGGIHIDSSGVFVEPVATRKKADNSLAALSFFIHNELSEDSSGLGGMLGLGRPEKITFITGEGTPIALTIERGERTGIGGVSYNSITRTASTHVSETGFARVTPEQYQRIMNASVLLAKIDGDKRSMTYEAKDISKTFQTNLKTFWNSYVGVQSK